jgi:hypothetical protein
MIDGTPILESAMEGSREIANDLPIDGQWESHAFFVNEDAHTCAILPIPDNQFDNDAGKIVAATQVFPKVAVETNAHEALIISASPVTQILEGEKVNEAEFLSIAHITPEHGVMFYLAQIGRPEGGEHPILSEWADETERVTAGQGDLMFLPLLATLTDIVEGGE